MLFEQHPVFEGLSRRDSGCIIIDSETGEVYDMERYPPDPTPEQKKARKDAYNQKHGLPVVMIPR